MNYLAFLILSFDGQRALLFSMLVRFATNKKLSSSLSLSTDFDTVDNFTCWAAWRTLFLLDLILGHIKENVFFISANHNKYRLRYFGDMFLPAAIFTSIEGRVLTTHLEPWFRHRLGSRGSSGFANMTIMPVLIFFGGGLFALAPAGCNQAPNPPHGVRSLTEGLGLPAPTAGCSRFPKYAFAL